MTDYAENVKEIRALAQQIKTVLGQAYLHKAGRHAEIAIRSSESRLERAKLELGHILQTLNDYAVKSELTPTERKPDEVKSNGT
jgi:hypothetical protein